MSRWFYDGYTKDLDSSGKRMIEKWHYRCSVCGHIIRTEPKGTAILTYTICPNCNSDMRGLDDE